MKYPALLPIILSLLLSAFSQQKNDAPKSDPGHADGVPLLYSEGGAFLIEGPKGWILDQDAGKQIGTCCVYYPQGSTWDNAQTVMYPSIVTKGPGKKTLGEFMKSDLADFRKHDPAMSYEDAPDVALQHNRVAKVRMFDGVNRGSSEAVAYIDEEKIIALLVVNSKTKKGLEESMPLLRSALQTYTYMDVKSGKGSKQGERPAQQIPKSE
jgi:hypothetical protein